MRQQSLPAFPSGYFDPDFQVGVDGRLLVMLSTFDLASTQVHLDRQPGERQPVIPSDARNIILALTGDEWREIASFRRSSHYYAYDVAPDDWCIVAEPRCRPGDLNAIPFERGVQGRGYCIGDGIGHLQCDDDGGFWVGYFDEGVFGNFGWGGRSNGPEPLGACGIRRFIRNGETSLLYPNEDGDIGDCYALNVTKSAAWSCYYTDFPIATLTCDGEHRTWSNANIQGASALAVMEPLMALVGGYRGDRQRIAVLRLENTQTKLVKTSSLQSAFPRVDLTRFRVIARGAEIHLVDQREWNSSSIEDLT